MFGRPQRVVAPSNEAAALVPIFETDPHGAAMFAGVLAGNALGGGRPVIDARGDAWGGWSRSPQRTDMHGAGNLGGGRPVVQPGRRLDQETGRAADPIRQAFEARMAGGGLT